MIKMVLNDYRYHFVLAIKNFFTGESLKYGNWFLYCYWIVYPWINNELEVGEIMFYYCAMGFLILGHLLSKLYPNRMDKTLFLCPLSRDAREKYFKTAFLLRIIVPTVFFLTISAVLLISRMVSGISLIISLAVLVMYFISVNIYMDSPDKNLEILSRKYSLPGYFPIWHVAAQISGLFNLVILSVYSPNSYGAIIMEVILLFIQLLIMLKLIFTYLKPIMVQSINYETCYVNLEKR